MSKYQKTLKALFDKLLQTYPERFVILFFNHGMAGSSVLRILLCHREFSISSKYPASSDYDDPIQFPDSVEGFDAHTDHFLSFTEQHLACAHLGFYTPWDSDEEYFEDIYEYFRLFKQNKFLALKTHQIHLYNKYKKSNCVFLYATKDFHRNIPCDFDKDISKEIPNEAFKIDVSRLFSLDYEEFLDEYLKIVYEFDLTPRINSVRSFVLLWLERQKRLNNFKQREVSGYDAINK